MTNPKDFITQLCEHCGLQSDQVKIGTIEDDDQITIQIDVPEEESGLFIGHHGETLESLQRIARIIFQKNPEDKRIVLNINDYREQREKKLAQTARSVADRVLQTGQEHTFHTYFSAQERFIIHSTLSEDGQYSSLESTSSGDGRDRRLTIRLKKAQ
jgi:spoIIIJ-associated protein